MAMFIQQLSQLTGASKKAIRHYESIGLLPPPQRAANNYRIYTNETVERLRFIVAARGLDFSLADIAEFIEARDNHQLPCHNILDSLDQHIAEIDRRIADLLTLRETLAEIHQEANDLPADSECDEQCVCYLLTVNRENGQITIQQERNTENVKILSR